MSSSKIEPNEVLKIFPSITLKEMDGVKLMNRTDTKYIFPIGYFQKVMEEIKDDYRILEIENKRLCRYETLYYDTATYELYRQHHSGKLNRYKIRHRTYVDSHTGFLEVKFKNNKGRTIKTRISHEEVPYAWEDDCNTFLSKTLPFDPLILKPVIWINYNRYTLVNKRGAERVTVDLDLEFKKDGRYQKLGNLVIAEVKQDKRKASPFMDVMKKFHLREGSISKYCMGIATVCDEVKKNNFKNKLTIINKKNIC
jgi:hypothetical protein